MKYYWVVCQTKKITMGFLEHAKNKEELDEKIRAAGYDPERCEVQEVK